MVERSKSRRIYRQRTPREVVAGCKAYSTRLKEKPLPVHLHTKPGTTAKGTVTLATDLSGDEQLVVQAEGSQLFGLVKLSHRHVFKVGELERSQSTHTAFLRRSVKILTKGNEAAKENMLERSLSLIHEREAVDITCDSKEECERLAVWIDAKWSVAMIQKSFRGNPRIALALQGRNKTFNDRGLYETLVGVQDEESGNSGPGNGGFGVLPKLDGVKLAKLQDDLLDGVHVTYHDLALGGYYSRSSPRRLRYDCESKEGLIYLEASYEEDGVTIVQNISDLLQVGGGPSAHGPTAGLLRATQGNPVQREAAVSLVFKNASIDITCGTKQDAHELVLYFSDIGGFKLARTTPRVQRVIRLPPLKEKTLDIVAKAPSERPTPGVIAPEAIGNHRASFVTPFERANVSSAAEACHRKGASNLSSSTTNGPPSPTFSTRFRAGIEAIGKDHATQLSASSGFGLDLTRSLSESSSCGSSAIDRSAKRSSLQPVVLQRTWGPPTKGRNGGGGRGGNRSDQAEPSASVTSSALSRTGPLPQPLPQAKGKKGRSVTPQPQRRPPRLGDSRAVDLEQSAERPSSGAGKRTGGSRAAPNIITDTGAGAGGSRTPPGWPNTMNFGRTRGGTTFEPQRRFVGGKKDSPPRDGQAGTIPKGHDSTFVHNPSDVPLNRRHLFKSAPTSGNRPEKLRSAGHTYRSAPGDQGEGDMPRTVDTEPSGERYHRNRSDGDKPSRTPDHSPRAGKPRHSPTTRRGSQVDDPDQEDSTNQPKRRATPKELQRPLKEIMRHGTRRRGTVGDTQGKVSPRQHQEKQRRSTLGANPSTSRPSAAEAKVSMSRDRVQADRKSTNPRDRGNRGLKAENQETHDRSRARSVPRSHPEAANVASAPALRNDPLLPRRVVVPFHSPQEVFSSALEAQAAAELESPAGRATGDEGLPGGARRRFGGIERTELVEQADPPPTLSPRVDHRPRANPGGRRHEDDDNFTTCRVKEGTVGARRHSCEDPRDRASSPFHREGGRRKAIKSLLREGGEKLKNFASGGGVLRRDGADKSYEGDMSPSQDAVGGLYRRQIRHGGRFFSNPRGSVASAVETFTPEVEPTSSGVRNGHSRSPA